MNKQHSGVALVQVLLITAMILLLVVQLSNDAKQQIQTSQLNKNKVIALIEMKTQLEEIKYEMLDIDFVQNRVFFGQTQSAGSLAFSVQDYAGLLSLSYGVEEIARFLEVEVRDVKIQNLQQWQGLESNSVSDAAAKGGLIQYEKELFLIPKWEEDKELEKVITAVPTPVFSPLSSPLIVLEKFFGAKVAQEINQKRTELDVYGAQALIKLSGNNDASETSDIFRITVSKEVGDSTLQRNQLVRFDRESQLLVQILEY